MVQVGRLDHPRYYYLTALLPFALVVLECMGDLVDKNLELFHYI